MRCLGSCSTAVKRSATWGGQERYPSCVARPANAPASVSLAGRIVTVADSAGSGVFPVDIVRPILPTNSHPVLEERITIGRHRHGESRGKRCGLFEFESRIEHGPIAADGFVHKHCNGIGLVVAQ